MSGVLEGQVESNSPGHPAHRTVQWKGVVAVNNVLLIAAEADKFSGKQIAVIVIGCLIFWLLIGKGKGPRR